MNRIFGDLERQSVCSKAVLYIAMFEFDQLDNKDIAQNVAYLLQQLPAKSAHIMSLLEDF